MVDEITKMSYSSTINSKAASREHVLAVTRDFNSQPRLSKLFFSLVLAVFFCVTWVGEPLLMDGREYIGHVIALLLF